MQDDPALLSGLIKPDRPHHPAAEGSPVAGAFVINVLAPQAVRAVIPVAAADEWSHRSAAVLTGEGFFTGDERQIKTKESKKTRETRILDCVVFFVCFIR